MDGEWERSLDIKIALENLDNICGPRLFLLNLFSIFIK